MRGLEIDHVTPFRPITRLDFGNLNVVRGTPYKISQRGLSFILSNMGASLSSDNSPYLTKPTNTCDPYVMNSPHI